MVWINFKPKPQRRSSEILFFSIKKDQKKCRGMTKTLRFLYMLTQIMS